jgi:hypothetical protein
MGYILYILFIKYIAMEARHSDSNPQDAHTPPNPPTLRVI